VSIGASKGMVADAAKQLITAWKATRRDWDDDAARWFEREFLDPVSPKIRSAVSAMDKLASLAAQAERDCNDD
jgi:hypothetical protein